ncbi:MAG: hypothetical protein NDJ89_04890 [Oligoflexia bacterium]|nr:hypothetical protein [Oligoflexia bacterium]
MSLSLRSIPTLSLLSVLLALPAGAQERSDCAERFRGLLVRSEVDLEKVARNTAGYKSDRSLEVYDSHLFGRQPMLSREPPGWADSHARSLSSLRELREEDTWIDVGSGTFRMMRELQAELSGAGKSVPRLIGIAPDLPEGQKVGELLAVTEPDRFIPIFKRVEEVTEIPARSARLVTDFHGGLAYTERPDLALLKMLGWLKPEGELRVWARSQGVRLPSDGLLSETFFAFEGGASGGAAGRFAQTGLQENGWPLSELFYNLKVGKSGFAHADLVEYLRRCQGVDVKAEKMDGNNLRIIVRRTGGPIELPELLPVDRNDDLPPVRVFLFTGRMLRLARNE